MGARVELSSGLREHVPGYDPHQGVAARAGCTVADIVRQLGIPAQEVQVVTINRRVAGLQDLVAEGDLVGLFPPLGGG